MFFAGIPAIILGRRACRRAKESPDLYGGQTLAKAGWITGVVGTALTTVLMMIGMAPDLARWMSKLDEPTTCRNNLKQIALGVRIYSSDHNETFPASLIQLTDELPAPKVFVCPDAIGYISPAENITSLRPQNVSYVYLLANQKEDPSIYNRMMALCPVHNLVAWGDGSVRPWSDPKP
jgi:hypothetical protein